jgi:germacradienol/geosmin synthase
MNEGALERRDGPEQLGGPAGLGTSAARIFSSLAATAPQRMRSFQHKPFEPVGPIDQPEITLPFPLTLSPHLDQARENIVGWSQAMGILDGVVWDEHKLRAFDLPLCAAGIHPDATPEQLDLTSGWLTWGTYGDDYYPVVFGTTGNVAGAKAMTERFKLFLPVDDEPMPPPLNALETALADLWSRTTATMARDFRQQFRKAIVDMLESWVWELANQVQNRIPDPIDYVEMRRKTFGSELTMSLCRIGHGRTVPPEIYRTRTIQAIEHSAMDYACLLNDVFSYRKEIQYEGELHNAVLVVRNFLDVGEQEAFEVVANLMAARLQEFQHAVDVALPTLFTDYNLDDAARKTLLAYTGELKNWLAGILNWHEGCHRYTEPELSYRPAAPVTPAAHPFSGPTGLGTSSLKISSLLPTP